MKEKNRLSQDQIKYIVESKNNNILVNPQDYTSEDTKNLKIICGSCGKIFVSTLSSI